MDRSGDAFWRGLRDGRGRRAVVRGRHFHRGEWRDTPRAGRPGHVHGHSPPVERAGGRRRAAQLGVRPGCSGGPPLHRGRVLVGGGRPAQPGGRPRRDHRGPPRRHAPVDARGPDDPEHRGEPDARLSGGRLPGRWHCLLRIRPRPAPARRLDLPAFCRPHHRWRLWCLWHREPRELLTSPARGQTRSGDRHGPTVDGPRGERRPAGHQRLGARHAPARRHAVPGWRLHSGQWRAAPASGRHRRHLGSAPPMGAIGRRPGPEHRRGRHPRGLRR